MITVFICLVEDCPNLNVVYRIEDAPEVVFCGGCGLKLDGSADV